MQSLITEAELVAVIGMYSFRCVGKDTYLWSFS